MTKSLFNYLRRVGIALSVLLNVVLGGKSNQTFSARNYSLQRRNLPNLVWLIDLSEKDHCMDRWINWKIIQKALEKHGL